MKFCVNCGAQTSSFADTIRPDASVGSAQQATAVLSYSNGLAGVLAGRTIEHKYRLDSLLGTGGMGAVYQATRLHIGDTVAVKILHPEQGMDPHAAERFRREAQIAARLKHPNAVSIYDFGVSPDRLMYLVMELSRVKACENSSNSRGRFRLTR
jgi:eukaryotic-like serine/threonine-protein kinase